MGRLHAPGISLCRTGACNCVPGRMIRQIPVDPSHDEIGQSVHLGIGQRPTFGNAMPFLDASAAACRRRMLGGEHRVPAPRRLPAVVGRLRLAHACAQHLMRMPVDDMSALVARIRPISLAQHELRTELRFAEPHEGVLHPRGFVIMPIHTRQRISLLNTVEEPFAYFTTLAHLRENVVLELLTAIRIVAKIRGNATQVEMLVGQDVGAVRPPVPQIVAVARRCAHLPGVTQYLRVLHDDEPMLHQDVKGLHRRIHLQRLNVMRMLQLQHAHDIEALQVNSTMQALDVLVEHGLIVMEDAKILRDAWQMCTAARNGNYLWNGRANRADILPDQHFDLSGIATYLGYDPDRGQQFENDILSQMRKSREVCERLFYGVEE